MEVADKHGQLLVKEAGILGLRKDRFRHGRVHHRRRSILLVLGFLQPRLTDVVVD